MVLVLYTFFVDKLYKLLRMSAHQNPLYLGTSSEMSAHRNPLFWDAHTLYRSAGSGSHFISTLFEKLKH